MRCDDGIESQTLWDSLKNTYPAHTLRFSDTDDCFQNFAWFVNRNIGIFF